MRYKVGDKVTIGDIYDGVNYSNMDGDPDNGIGISFEMRNYIGRSATIVRVDYDAYRLDIDGGRWCWTDGMFEGGIMSPFQEWELNSIKGGAA